MIILTPDTNSVKDIGVFDRDKRYRTMSMKMKEDIVAGTICMIVTFALYPTTSGTTTLQSIATTTTESLTTGPNSTTTLSWTSTSSTVEPTTTTIPTSAQKTIPTSAKTTTDSPDWKIAAASLGGALLLAIIIIIIQCIVYKRKINKFAGIENPGLRDKQLPNEGQLYQHLEPKISDCEQETAASSKYVNVEELRAEQTAYTTLNFRNGGIPTPDLRISPEVEKPSLEDDVSHSYDQPPDNGQRQHFKLVETLSGEEAKPIHAYEMIILDGESHPTTYTALDCQHRKNLTCL